MMNWLPVCAAFAAVFGMIGFLVYCAKEIDAESKRVNDYRSP
jgi:hypothetical protein